MSEFLSAYLEPLLAFITGGGIVSLVKWKSIKQQAEADAMKAVQDVYQETIKDLREDKEVIKKDNSELRQKLVELQQMVYQNSVDIGELKQFKCVVMDCKLRKQN